MKKNRPKIEGIFPLSFMQRALLFHSLLEEEDQGLIQIQCKLEGNLNVPLFQDAWQEVIRRHEALRSSIHWEKVAEPVQLIRPEANMNWQIEDWRTLDQEGQTKQIEALLARDKKKKLNFNKAVISRFYLIQLNETAHYFLWTSHHILLDGWSAAIVLQNVFEVYDARYRKVHPTFESIPSHKSYLAWIKKQEIATAAAFWKQHLEGFRPKLLAKHNTVKKKVQQRAFRLSSDQSEKLQNLARRYRATFNTLLQAAWSLVLAQLLDEKDFAFGNTVSGRSAHLPNMEKMVGLFTNALPIRIRLAEEDSFFDYLTKLQKAGTAARSIEHVSLEQILSWAAIKDYSKLFDTLLVVQNYPWENLGGGNILVRDFEGDLTTTFPLTLIVLPGKEMEFVFRYFDPQIKAEQIDWLTQNLRHLLLSLEEKVTKASTLKSLLSILSDAPSRTTTVSSITPAAIPSEYNNPTNETELQLTQIWESILGIAPIQTTDDFFELGGTSLLAVRMFSKINTVFNKKLPPILLLKHRTIQQLSTKLSEDAENTWSSLVPLKANGSKDPLFCFHAGQGHVFFYNELAQQLNDDRPVYAIQPQGLNGEEMPHSNIQEMATFYLQEMKKIQKNGRYNILGFCFSNAVCFEIAKQLKQSGELTPLLIIVDSSPSLAALKRGNISLTKSLFSQGKKKSKQLLQRLFLSESDNKDLEKVRDKLSQMYLDYRWQPYDGSILFLRSSQFNTQDGKEFHLEVWSKLIKGGMDVEVSEGRHRELFKSPAVMNTARILRQYLN
ncbi:MAG: condensation domain-containing protein [Bacteroidota bacterium]